MKLLSREPAVLLALIASAIRLVAAFLVDLNVEQQALLNAVATAAVGLAVASMVRDGLVAAVLGLAQALFALSIGFGLNFSAEDQAVIMTFVSTAVAMFVRTQVSAPVDPDGVTRPLH